MARALFIDATRTRTITHINLAEGSAALSQLHKLIGGYIEGAHRWSNGDVLFVDEEGLLKPWCGGFVFAPRADDQPLAGNGVVVGREIEGSGWPGGYTTIPPRISASGLRRLVMFLDADGEPVREGN